MLAKNYKQFLALAIGCLLTTTHATAGFIWSAPKKTQPDLWEHLRARFTMSDASQIPEVRRQIAYFKAHRHWVYQLAEQASPYLYYILQEAEKRNMPAEVVLLPMIESAYNPFAYSQAGAAGLWQIMPKTGMWFGLKRDWWYDGRRDIVSSTQVALDYLQDLEYYFAGNWLLAMASYDAGQHTVKAAVRRNRRRGKPVDFWHLRLPRETRTYVPRLLALVAIIKNPQKYGMQLPALSNRPYFTRIPLKRQIDLSLAAKLANIDLKTLYELNPGYSRWATDPDGPHSLILPIENAAKFKVALAHVPLNKRVLWRRHVVTRRETLSGIAKRYHTTPKLLVKTNQLHGTLVKPGRVLVIPVARKAIPRERLIAQQAYFEQHRDNMQPAMTIYRIKAGDTLWDLRKKFKVSIAALRFWNHMTKNQSLIADEKLIIWTPTLSRKAVRNPALPTRIIHTVKHNQTLSGIAHRYRVKVADLRQWNPKSTTKRYIQPGDRLIVLKQYG